MFATKRPLDSLHQVIAENFYPERADFTRELMLGEEFASHLMTGYPVMIRREMANAVSSMLRPSDKVWAHARTDNDRINEDSSSRAVLDRVSGRLRKIMYQREAQLTRATKEGDNDWTSFGQCVISGDLRKNRDGLLYRCWHLRDCAWAENAELKIDTFHRNWMLQARQLVKMWPDKVSPAVKNAEKTDPFKKIKCREIIIPADEYDLGGPARRFPFVCIYVDIENDTILEEAPLPVFNKIIPRWVTVSGSQYAHSPATIVALPDARLLQRITLTLLEAGEKAVDPPMKAMRQAIQGGVDLYAGGVTWVDAEYDEKTGAALEPIWKSNPNLGWGVDRENRIAEMIDRAFYRNQIQVPYMEGKMTATEYRGRVEDYIRQALPLFEPMQVEYNGALCDLSFEMAMRNGWFADILEDMPRQLARREIQWRFESPLQDATERAKSQAFVEASEALKIAAEADPLIPSSDFDMRKAFRDALIGTGAPADWAVPREIADKLRADAAAAQEAQAGMQEIAGGAEVAKMAGEAVAAAGKGARELQSAGA